MKKNLFTTSLLAWLMCLLMPARVMAQTEVDGLWYMFDENTKTATVVQYQGTKYEGSIVIPSSVNGYSVTSIGSGAFYECYYLTSITIPESVTSIGEEAFYDCCYLTSITIPYGVTSIGDYAFEDCSRLFRITIPESVTSIGFSAFGRCISLTSATIPGSVTNLGEHAFQNCVALTSITISEGVASIGYGTFFGCTSLTSITIPESVTSIGLSAFNCSGLTSITIPRNVRSIGDSAFAGCNLTSINVESENPFFDSRENCNAIINSYTNQLIAGCKNTIIPENVTSIGWNAFGYCSGLTSISIPEGVTRIGRYAFDNCSDLTTVTVKNPTPVAIESETFSNRANATLYVPADSKAAYEAADYWKEFKEIVEMPSIETFSVMLDGVEQTLKGTWVVQDNNDFIVTESGTYRVKSRKERSMGDVNGDDKITIADVTALVNVILGSGSVGPAVIYDVESVGE